jgi:AcrR family transcriptional regulator
MAVPRSSRERPRARPSHDAILAAAEALFAERGYADTSLRELIAACGVSTTAFYARFATKEAVLETLLRDLFVDLHDAAALALPSAKNPAQGFDKGVDLLVAAITHRRGLLRIALTEAASSSATRAVMREAYGMLAALLAGQIARLVARGRIDVADADALAWALVGALLMQVMRWAVFEELGDDELAEALRATSRTMLPASRKKS